jgi:hypothetical protein
MDRANADCFLADVVSIDGTIFTIQPLIKEFDGTPHIEVTAISRVTPGIGDTVLVLTMRNNLDLEEISRYYKASASNCTIIGVMKTTANPNYVLTGNYNFIGDTLFTGNLNVTGNVTIDGNLTVGSNADVTGNVGIDGILTLAGTNMNLHIHQAGALISAAPGNPVTGVTGLMV